MNTKVCLLYRSLSQSRHRRKRVGHGSYGMYLSSSLSLDLNLSPNLPLQHPSRAPLILLALSYHWTR